MLFIINENNLDDYTYELANITSFNALTAVSGDQIRIETEMKKNKSDIVSFGSRGYVNGTQCSEIKLNIRQANPTTSITFVQQHRAFFNNSWSRGSYWPILHC